MFRKEMRILEVLLLVNVEFQRPVKGFQVLGRSVRWNHPSSLLSIIHYPGLSRRLTLEKLQGKE